MDNTAFPHGIAPDDMPEGNRIDAERRDSSEDIATAHVINMGRFKQMEVALCIVERITRDMDVRVSYKLNEPFISMGSISIEGDNIKFKDIDSFMEVSDLADSIDVYPLAKRGIRISFTFHSLAQII